MIIDNESAPGSWKRELERAPWAYGQTQEITVKRALEDLRFHNFNKQADTLEREILTLKRELEYLREKNGR